MKLLGYRRANRAEVRIVCPGLSGAIQSESTKPESLHTENEILTHHPAINRRPLAMQVVFRSCLCILAACLMLSVPTFAQAVNAPTGQPGNISGTVTDAESDVIPGATVTLEAPGGSKVQTVTANDYGGFAFNGVAPGGPYHIHITAQSCIPWTSPGITLQPGQFLTVKSINVVLSGGTTSVIVRPPQTQEQIATQQIKQEEKQRVLGIIPNFYVSYDKHAVPLSTKLKYKLAFRTATDPVTILGAAFLAGIDQAADTPDYQEGLKGYMQRFGANYTDAFTDIMIGGAVLPALLHQDPRYFYQGTGTRRSRLMHAISSPFLCRGDNGKTEINYSSMGGDLASASLSELYYPASNRGASIVFENAAITTGGRVVNAVIQEFILKKFTSNSSHKH